MRQKPSLTEEDVAIILQACRTAAAAQKWAVSIAVVDEAGILWRLERLDGAPLPSARIAERKAYTAATARVPTKALEDVLKDRPAFLAVQERLPLQGGLPILVGTDCVGGIGVSGVKSPEDEQVALAGLRALLPA